MGPTTKSGKDLLSRIDDGGDDCVWMAAAIGAIEQEATFKHTDPAMQERCDGRCATDECVCPEGGWAEECDRLRQALNNRKPPEGFFTCALCGDLERKEDEVVGLCLACADAVAFEQHNRRSKIVVMGES